MVRNRLNLPLLTAVAFMVAVFVPKTNAIDVENGVLILNDNNFKEIIVSNDFVLLYCYSSPWVFTDNNPWHQRANQRRTAFEAEAQTLDENQSHIKFAKSGFGNFDLHEEMDIDLLPEWLLFR